VPMKNTSTKNQPIITNPTNTFTSTAESAPTAEPNPVTAAFRASCSANRSSKTQAPISGPRMSPSGKKKRPATAPTIAPIAPHLVPPNHRIQRRH